MIHKYQFVSKILNRLSSEKNRFWRYLPIGKISSRGIGAIPTIKEFRNKVESMLGPINRDLMSRVSKEERDVIVHEADVSLSHTFDLLGSGPVRMERIDWHTDFKSGYTWPKGTYYKRLRSMCGRSSDIKVPWELSRCHHLLWLAEAYLITNKEEYAQEVVDEIVDWIEENPYMHSVNWTCAMDVSIRVVNWLYAINMIWESKCMTDEFVSKLYKSLYQHGFYIYNNLEKRVPYSNNHYFSDLVGLLYLGRLFKHTKRGLKWWRFGLSEYYMEIRLQTLPSGANYERSISYHRLMTELASYPLYMLKRVGEVIPHDVVYRVGKMYDYIVNYTKSNGRVPLVGDNDDGRLLPFVKRDFRYHRYLVDRISCENIMVSSNIGEIFILYSNKSQSIADYRDSGCVIKRDGELYLYITNGERGCYTTNSLQRFGSHSHSDLLSFEMSLGNDDIFVDSGSYIYTANLDKHIEFRTTKKHNTIIVDNEEQLIPTSTAFVSTLNVAGQYLTISESGVIDGEYSTLGENMTHHRRFVTASKSLIIEDAVIKDGANHTLLMYFHLAPNVDAVVDGNTVSIQTRYKHVNIEFDIMQPCDLKVINDTYSPSYGVQIDTNTIAVSLCFNNKVTIQTKILWE